MIANRFSHDTRDLALAQVRAALRPGRPVYTFLYMPGNRWSWATPESPLGRACAEAEMGAGVHAGVALYCVELTTV